MKSHPTPLEYIVVDGVGSDKMLRMDNSTTTTAIQQIVQWISSEDPDGEWHAVSFYFGEFGKSFYFPRDEKLCDEADNIHWNHSIGEYVCWDKPVSVSFKNLGWGRGIGDEKTTFSVVVDYGLYYHTNAIPNSVFMRSLAGKQSLLENILPSDTIQIVKEKHTAETGIPTSSLRFIFDGHQLEDEKTLADYGISNCSVIFVVLRLRGGEGEKFVDVTKGQLVDYDWNNKAPN